MTPFEEYLFKKRARNFAKKKHEGQVRKYTGEPYYNHCKAVADMVASKTNNHRLIAAAYLHDTLEDTDTTVTELEAAFGDTVAKIVCDLTDVYTHEAFPHLRRAERKRHEAFRYQTAVGPGARLVKLCDLIDNTRSIVEHDPDFAVTYLREKANLLQAMGYGK